MQKAKRLLETWLSTMGLELKPSKTRITHTLQNIRGRWASIFWAGPSDNFW